jgi:uncharacterized iron-regulated protein
MISLLLAQIDANNLDIGPPGKVEVRLNAITDTKTGKTARVADIVEAASAAKYVLIGETHDNMDAHIWQSRIIAALSQSGRAVVVGLEMYQRPKQAYLDKWTLGRFSESEFLEQSDWKGQWGFDFALYRPIFSFAKERGLRMVGLNIPRDWVRAVGRGGPDALPPEAKQELPALFLGNTDHKKVFDALTGGHPGMNPNSYAAQVLWDEAMADTAAKFWQHAYTNPQTVMAIVAGNGHVMYRQGIGYRLQRNFGDRNVTIVTVDIPVEQYKSTVSRGLGDFVIGVREPTRSK